MAKQHTDIAFPIRGLHEGLAHRELPEGATPSCLNVRDFDPIDDRLRGGVRAGLSKYITAAMPGPVQWIGQGVIPLMVGALDPDTVVDDNGDGYTEDFREYPRGRVTYFETAWEVRWSNYQSEYDAGMVPDWLYESGFNANMKAYVLPGGWSHMKGAEGVGFLMGGCAILQTATPLTSNYVLSMEVRFSEHDERTCRVAWVFRVSDTPTASGYYAVELRKDVAGGGNEGAYLNAVLVHFADDHTATDVASSGWRELLDPTDSLTFDTLTFKVEVSGDALAVYLGDVEILLYTLTEFSSQTGVGWGVQAAAQRSVVVRKIKVATGTLTSASRQTRLVAACLGRAYIQNPEDAAVLDLVDGQDSTRMDVRLGRVMGVGAAGSPDDSDTFKNHRFIYFVDGTQYTRLDINDRRMRDWAADDGSMPVGLESDYPAIIALYRNRIVLSGVRTDPATWYMSAVGDSTDWDYSPTTTSATMAVAGNSSDAGNVGDVVRALVAFSDDMLVFGCDHSIWILRGDPAAGGSIDALSYQTGFVQSAAHTWDETNTLYFFGTGGIYRMAPNALPELLTSGRLDKRFNDVDLAATLIHMQWDRRYQGMHVFLTPISQGTSNSTHWFWSRRTDSWWKDSFVPDHGPTASYVIDGDAESDRHILVGGHDGYIRKSDPSASDDDGQPIASHVVMAVLTGGTMPRVKLLSILTEIDSASSDVDISIYAGTTAEAAVTAADAGSAYAVYRTLTAGRSTYLRNRVAANAIAIRLGGTSRWAVERMTASLEMAGLARRLA